MGKARDRPTWFLRMQRTTALKRKIAELLRAWPTDGTSTHDVEALLLDAVADWEADMRKLPKVAP